MWIKRVSAFLSSIVHDLLKNCSLRYMDLYEILIESSPVKVHFIVLTDRPLSLFIACVLLLNRIWSFWSRRGRSIVRATGFAVSGDRIPWPVERNCNASSVVPEQYCWNRSDIGSEWKCRQSRRFAYVYTHVCPEIAT